MEYEIRIYATENGKEPFKEWLDLHDLDTRAVVFQRLQRIRLGNFGDCKSIGEGLWEFRIHHKSGLRIYYARVGNRLILILGAGEKRSQVRDISKAQAFLDNYRRRTL